MTPALDNAPTPTLAEVRQREAVAALQNIFDGIQGNGYGPDRLKLKQTLVALCTANPLAAASVLYRAATTPSPTPKQEKHND